VVFIGVGANATACCAKQSAISNLLYLRSMMTFIVERRNGIVDVGVCVCVCVCVFGLLLLFEE
jgi:hypothetical protein